MERLGVQLRHAGHAAHIMVHTVNALVHEFVVHPPKDMDEDTFVGELGALLEGYLMQPCQAREPTE